MSKYALTAYPPREQTYRAAEAANRAARPGHLRTIDGCTSKLFAIYEMMNWDGAIEVPRRRLKQSMLKLMPLGVLQTRRSQRRNGDYAQTSLWLACDGHLYEGSVYNLRRLKPRQIKSHSQLERLAGILPEIIGSAQVSLAEHRARLLAG